MNCAVLCFMFMCVLPSVLFTAAAITRALQPDGHKMHGSYINMTTWDSQFHECACKLNTVICSSSSGNSDVH